MMRFMKWRSTVQKRIIYKKTASLAQNAGDAVLIIAVKNFTAACKKDRININDYHARLFVNSAMTMADFILAVSEHAA